MKADVPYPVHKPHNVCCFTPNIYDIGRDTNNIQHKLEIDATA
jgi:hypothetical protein